MGAGLGIRGWWASTQSLRLQMTVTEKNRKGPIDPMTWLSIRLGGFMSMTAEVQSSM